MRSKRILVVTPYAPWRDGIAAYAIQQVESLRRQGDQVEVMSPKPSAAHHYADMRGLAGARRLRRVARRFDQVIIHFHPDFFYYLPPTAGIRLSSGLAYGSMFRSLRADIELRIHEIDSSWASPSDPTARATRFMLRGADRITVHSASQATILTSNFGVPAKRVSVVDHGADFRARTSMDRAHARTSLGLPADEHIFLCIGFLQEHKGFDRAARAFSGLAERAARLDIVGSTRITDDDTVTHLAELEALERSIEGVNLHPGYLSDEMFDRWIVASDTVVLPYRHIWSSGVMERARLLDRPVIATETGSLAEQAAEWDGATIVSSDAELALEMAKRVGATADVALPWPPAPAEQVLRVTVQDEIERRARSARGGAPAPRVWVSQGLRPPLSAKVRKIGSVQAMPAISARPGVSLVKRLIRRVIAWEVMPIADQVNRLQKATAEALDDAERQRR